MALILGVLARRKAVVVSWLAASAFAFGLAEQGWAWRDSGRRLAAGFHGSAVREAELFARLGGAPERDRDGGREILVETIPQDGIPKLRLRLDVLAVPSDDAARVDGLRRGDVVRVFCRLRAPEARAGTTADEARRRLAAGRCHASGTVKSSRLLRRVACGGWSPWRVIDEAHARARTALDAAVGSSGDTRAVLGAMLFGDRLLMSDEVNGWLRDAGLVHILSISGLHTTITILVLLAMLRRSGLGSRGLLFAGGASLVAFSAFVGDGAAVWRACASLAVGLVARVLSRDGDALSSLALASAVLVLAVPTLAFNVGFLLSVVATAGLLAMRRPDSSVLHRSFAASTGAYLASAPILAATFGRLAPAALVSNLVAAPLCAACLASGAAAVVASRIPYAGGLAAEAAHLSVDALLSASRTAAAIPGGHFRVAAPGPLLAVTYVSCLLAAWLFAGPRSTGTARALRLGVMLTAIALHLGAAPPQGGAARVTIMDVGQGLAVALCGADGRFALVDAGPSGRGRFDAGDRIVVPELTQRGCRRLDVLALSHDHDDHAGGAGAVLRDIEVGELWVGIGSHRDPVTRLIVADAVARGVAVRGLRRGDGALSAGLRWTVLHPGREDRNRPLNDRCLVLRATTTDGASILLPGDLEAAGETSLLASGADPKADALVAAHHGANGSSTSVFLARVAPRIVVVSAGAHNRFGHPGPAALARFDAVSARVLRTDRGGTISLLDRDGTWTGSVEREGRHDEGQDEDHREDDAHRAPAGAERLGFVDEPGMPVSQPDQDDQPQAVGRRSAEDDALHHDEDEHRADRRKGRGAMRLRRDREERMPAVQLSHGEKVHRGHQHPDPRGAVHRADLNRRIAEKPMLENP